MNVIATGAAPAPAQSGMDRATMVALLAARQAKQPATEMVAKVVERQAEQTEGAILDLLA